MVLKPGQFGKYFRSFEVYCWRRVEINWTDYVEREVQRLQRLYHTSTLCKGYVCDLITQLLD